MPKNCDEKIVTTRVIYNSKFRLVNKRQANKNIRRNVSQTGTSDGVNSVANISWVKTNSSPKQLCHVVQDRGYSVPVKNQFDALDTDIDSHIDSSDSIHSHVENKVEKSRKVCVNSTSVLGKHTDEKIQFISESEGKSVAVHDIAVNNGVVVDMLNDTGTNKHCEPDQSHSFPAANNGVVAQNATNVDTEPCSSREIPSPVVDQYIPDFCEKVPLWDCKLAKQEQLREAASVPDFQNWKAQNKFLFGFIPLSPLVGVKNWEENGKIQSPIEAHRQISASGVYNFQKERLLLESQLNSQAWEKHLQNYWDWQLVQYIKFGFPLDVQPNADLTCDWSNHKSATLFPSHVDTYLQEERSFNAMHGPFTEKPFKNLHCSPFLTREKPDSENRRVIVDLSWPKGNSVNDFVDSDHYMGTKFMLTFPSIDDITSQITRLGRGCLLYKVDISRAFRHIKMDPSDYQKLGLNWDGFYFDSCLPFGFKHGSKIFQRTSDAVRFIMNKQNYDIINYIDDLIGFGLPSTVYDSFQYLCDLLQELGLTISKKKLVPPSTLVTCLGVQIDTVQGTIAVPPEKLQKIMHMCTAWENRSQVRKRDLQSLLGSLMHITKCVKSSRSFLNRMLQNLRNAKNADIVELNEEFYKDLTWFKNFLPHFNGVCLYNHQLLQGIVQVDASLQGLGGRWNNCVYSLQIPLGMDNLGIVQLEMLNVYLALRIWAKYWAGRRVRFECDNQAVVTVLKTGRTRDPVLAAYARNIQMLASVFDIEVTVIHLPGIQNTVADLLSRWPTVTDNMVKLKQYIASPQWVPVHLDMLRIDWTI